MRCIICILCFFFCSVPVRTQSNCCQDSAKYLAAYQYIINVSANDTVGIVVSDSIVDLDRFWFYDHLVDFPLEKKIVKQYRINKQFIWFDTFYLPCISSMFCKNVSVKHVLFFSQIEDNMLIATLLPYTRQRDKFYYDEMARFTTGIIYLFIFEDNSTIKAVFCKTMIYD